MGLKNFDIFLLNYIDIKMNYPLTINNNNDIKTLLLDGHLDDILVEERDYIENLYCSLDGDIEKEEELNELREECKNKNDKLLDMEKKLQITLQKVEEYKNLVDLSAKRDAGESSIYKGEFCEKQLESVFKKEFTEDYEIDGGGETRRMDIRLTHTKTGTVIGIESKEKKIITRNDLEKFNRDKVDKEFKGSIFISTQGIIPKLVENINNFYLEGDKLYIYSNNMDIIVMLIRGFLSYLYLELGDDEFDANWTNDAIKDVYTTHQERLKIAAKEDKKFLNILRKLGLPVSNGHLYLVSKSKCKGARVPY